MFTNQPAKRSASKKPSTEIVPYEGNTGTADSKKIAAIEKFLKENNLGQSAVASKG
jgi:hypothetical protein